MHAHTSLHVLTGANLVILGVSLALQLASPHLGSKVGVLRGRGLEIVDDQGRIRASIQILPPDRRDDSTQASDTVLLRLITQLGRPSVKIGASESSSGLSFAGTTGTKNAWLVLKTEGNHSSLRLRDEDGRERLMGP